MIDKIKMYVVNLDGEAPEGGYLKIEDVDKHFVPKVRIRKAIEELKKSKNANLKAIVHRYYFTEEHPIPFSDGYNEALNDVLKVLLKEV